MRPTPKIWTPPGPPAQPTAMLDRLALNANRIDGIAAGLRQVAGLPDPVGEVLRGYTLPNGLQFCASSGFRSAWSA